jgi:glycosyltransferase involved in cell wall biosynthesis
MNRVCSGRPELRLPALVCDMDVADSLTFVPPVSGGRRVERAWILVRAFTEPLGYLMLDVPPSGLTPHAIAAAINRTFGPLVRAKAESAGAQLPGGVPVDGIRTPQTPPYLAERQRTLVDAPPITVVICTRGRPAGLRVTVASVLAQQYPRFRVLVVDNAPENDEVERAVHELAAWGPVHYVRADEPGLSNARNAAVAAAPGEILAWIDDDAVADPHWLAEVARALANHPEADIVTGLIAPAELATDAQVWFEQFGGHSKGRGFSPDVFSPATAHRQHPLFPLPPFGTGANMVFRPGVIERQGGFDAALGAGTPAMGSEDTLAFMRVLYGGGTVVYQPSALVRHYHRRDLAGLHRQMVGYGTGLTAAYTSLVLSDPRVILPLLRLIPTALREVLGCKGLRAGGLPEGFPQELLTANRSGMVRGPWLYLRGRWAHRRASRARRQARPDHHPETPRVDCWVRAL